MASLRISLYKVSRLIPNKAYASETLMKSCPLGKFLTTSSKRFCLSSSSFFRVYLLFWNIEANNSMNLKSSQETLFHRFDIFLIFET